MGPAYIPSCTQETHTYYLIYCLYSRGCHQPVLGTGRVGCLVCGFTPNPSRVSLSLCSQRKNTACIISAHWEWAGSPPPGAEIIWGLGDVSLLRGSLPIPRIKRSSPTTTLPGPDRVPLESQEWSLCPSSLLLSASLPNAPWDWKL